MRARVRRLPPAVSFRVRGCLRHRVLGMLWFDSAWDQFVGEESMMSIMNLVERFQDVHRGGRPRGVGGLPGVDGRFTPTRRSRRSCRRSAGLAAGLRSRRSPRRRRQRRSSRKPRGCASNGVPEATTWGLGVWVSRPLYSEARGRRQGRAAEDEDDQRLPDASIGPGPRRRAVMFNHVTSRPAPAAPVARGQRRWPLGPGVFAPDAGLDLRRRLDRSGQGSRGGQDGRRRPEDAPGHLEGSAALKAFLAENRSRPGFSVVLSRGDRADQPRASRPLGRLSCPAGVRQGLRRGGIDGRRPR